MAKYKIGGMPVMKDNKIYPVGSVIDLPGKEYHELKKKSQVKLTEVKKGDKNG